MTDKEEQDDELLALSSIYDNVLKVTQEDGLNGGELLACPILPEDFFVKIQKNEKECTPNVNSDNDLHRVKYLPPISLNFILPEDYPSNSPPTFTLSCKWLNRDQLTSLCHKLDSIWEENQGCVILFMWNTFLQDELFEFLDLISPLELAKVISQKQPSDLDLDPRAVQEISSQGQLLPVIIEYNKQEKTRQFEKSSFTCKVCFCEKPGSSCIMFYECDHVYCQDCMRDYFSVQIKEGNVKALECPENKCESQAHPTQVKQLVAPELFDKYDKLLLQTSLDMMLDVTYCPRPICQSVVLMDKESSMASCPECNFVFCVLCKLVYHGLSPCRLKSDNLQKLRQEYLNGDEGTKRLLEKRYGKVTIQQALEESFTNEWLNKHSKPCPGCGAHIQKIDGCNKMTCMKCRAYFCWLCNATLSRANPYSHYNSIGDGCFNRLFEGVDLGFDDDDYLDWEVDDQF